MKITLFINSIKGGGAERVACNLANYLVRRNYEVCILTFDNAETTYHLDCAVRVDTLLNNRRKKGSYFILLRQALKDYLLNKTPNVVVSFLPIATILLLSCRQRKRVRIVSAERNAPSQYPLRIRLLLKLLCRRADAFVFQTVEEQQWYNKHLVGVKTLIIPNAVNEEFLRPAYNGPREKKIVSVGRLEKQKNFPLLISAFGVFLQSHPNYKLEIWGKGSKLEKYKSLCAKLNIENHVSFPGYSKNIAQEIEKAGVFVLPSNYEGIPNALIEAMVLGVPCVATDCLGGGARYLIENGINGLLIPRNDEAKMVKAITSIVDDDDFAKRISSEARQIRKSLEAASIYSLWEKTIFDL